MDNKGNIGGLLILAIGVVIAIMGIKGSQHALFPQLFGTSGTNTPIWSPPYAGGMAPAPVSGPDKVSPGKGNSCPNGYIFFATDKMCHKLIPVAN